MYTIMKEYALRKIFKTDVVQIYRSFFFKRIIISNNQGTY